MTLFHFDLRYREDADDLRLAFHGSEFELVRHDATSLADAADRHAVLGALPQAAWATFTHRAEIPDAHFAGSPVVRYVQAVKPAAPGVHLPEVAAMAIYLPEDHLRAYYEQRLQRAARTPAEQVALQRHNQQAPPRLHSAKLHALGLDALPDGREAAIGLLVAAQTLVMTLDTAATLVAFHPELANVQPYTTAIVRNDHVLPDPEVDPDQYNAMTVLSNAIGAAGTWAPVIPCTDQHGTPLQAGYELKDEHGGFAPGQQLYTYSLVPAVAAAASPATGGARRTAADDVRLAGKTWAPTPGTSVIQQSPGRPARSAVGDLAYKWTVTERTDHHGVTVDPGSIKVDGAGTFTIDAANSYLRTLFAGYQLLDELGTPSGEKQKLHSVSATNTIMGIPTWTDPTSLSIPLGDAAGVQLLFGSLGTSDWDPLVSPPGALLTGLWQYGVPTVFLIAGKAFTSSSIFNKIVNDRELQAIVLAVGFGIVGGGLPTAAALTNTKSVLTAAGDAILTLAVQKGLETLGEWLIEQAGSGALVSAFGPVGWVLRLAAMGLDIEEMAVTTGEVLSSPACITVTAKRAIDVTLTMAPDPRHGEAGKPATAVWPAVATRYVATLQYKDGTSFQLKDELPATTSGTVLALRFADVPAGGSYRIFFGVYSGSGWLAGVWQSDWLAAQPTSGTTQALGEHAIRENLVPLAPDTQYVFKERITVSGGVFGWTAGGLPPSAPLTSLACGGGGTLCELVGITINDSAFQVGYAWRASGMGLPPDDPTAPPSNDQLYALQNLSVLARPMSRLKTSAIGLRNRPAIAYAPSTNSDAVVDETNFVVDPRGGGMNLRRVTLEDNRTTFGLEDPGLPSWGSLPLENVDAAAVHPSSAVIACSWQDSKLLLLDLPEAPAADGRAPTALMVSGEGLRQGLMQGPRALAVAPDGRILVLETVNHRVQAFDTKGNGVPGFTPGGVLATLPTAQVAAELNGGKVPEAVQSALAEAGLTFVGTIAASFAAQLDTRVYQAHGDPLIAALSAQGVLLAYDAAALGDPAQSAQILVVSAGSAWTVTDPRGFAWGIVAGAGGLTVSRRLAPVDVRVEHAGRQWLLIDGSTVAAWRLAESTGAPGTTEVRACLTFFPLRPARVGSITYLDMAVESQGHVYVLGYRDDGGKPGDYILDVYAPDGTFVLRTPDPSVTSAPQNVVAGRIAVDIWRNLYALTYEPLHAPGPQPGIAHWTPTPPLFTLSLSTQPDFNQRNIGAVVRDFAGQGKTLSNQAFITVDDPDGAWQVKDGTTIYHVYRSGDGLQVFAVPA